MRKTRLVILPGVRSITQIGCLLLYLSCPTIAFKGQERRDVEPICALSEVKDWWLPPNDEGRDRNSIFNVGDPQDNDNRQQYTDNRVGLRQDLKNHENEHNANREFIKSNTCLRRIKQRAGLLNNKPALKRRDHIISDDRRMNQNKLFRTPDSFETLNSKSAESIGRRQLRLSRDIGAGTIRQTQRVSDGSVKLRRTRDTGVHQPNTILLHRKLLINERKSRNEENRRERDSISRLPQRVTEKSMETRRVRHSMETLVDTKSIQHMLAMEQRESRVSTPDRAREIGISGQRHTVSDESVINRRTRAIEKERQTFAASLQRGLEKELKLSRNSEDRKELENTSRKFSERVNDKSIHTKRIGNSRESQVDRILIQDKLPLERRELGLSIQAKSNKIATPHEINIAFDEPVISRRTRNTRERLTDTRSLQRRLNNELRLSPNLEERRERADTAQRVGDKTMATKKFRDFRESHADAKSNRLTLAIERRESKVYKHGMDGEIAGTRRTHTSSDESVINRRTRVSEREHKTDTESVQRRLDKELRIFRNLEDRRVRNDLPRQVSQRMTDNSMETRKFRDSRGSQVKKRSIQRRLDIEHREKRIPLDAIDNEMATPRHKKTGLDEAVFSRTVRDSREHQTDTRSIDKELRLSRNPEDRRERDNISLKMGQRVTDKSVKTRNARDFRESQVDTRSLQHRLAIERQESRVRKNEKYGEIAPTQRRRTLSDESVINRRTRVSGRERKTDAESLQRRLDKELKISRSAEDRRVRNDRSQVAPIITDKFMETREIRDSRESQIEARSIQHRLEMGRQESRLSRDANEIATPRRENTLLDQSVVSRTIRYSREHQTDTKLDKESRLSRNPEYRRERDNISQQLGQRVTDRSMKTRKVRDSRESQVEKRSIQQKPALEKRESRVSTDEKSHGVAIVLQRKTVLDESMVSMAIRDSRERQAVTRSRQLRLSRLNDNRRERGYISLQTEQRSTEQYMEARRDRDSRDSEIGTRLIQHRIAMGHRELRLFTSGRTNEIATPRQENNMIHESVVPRTIRESRERRIDTISHQRIVDREFSLFRSSEDREMRHSISRRPDQTDANKLVDARMLQKPRESNVETRSVQRESRLSKDGWDKERGINRHMQRVSHETIVTRRALSTLEPQTETELHQVKELRILRLSEDRRERNSISRRHTRRVTDESLENKRNQDSRIRQIERESHQRRIARENRKSLLSSRDNDRKMGSLRHHKLAESDESVVTRRTPNSRDYQTDKISRISEMTGKTVDTRERRLEVESLQFRLKFEQREPRILDDQTYRNGVSLRVHLRASDGSRYNSGSNSQRINNELRKYRISENSFQQQKGALSVRKEFYESTGKSRRVRDTRVRHVYSRSLEQEITAEQRQSGIQWEQRKKSYYPIRLTRKEVQDANVDSVQRRSFQTQENSQLGENITNSEAQKMNDNGKIIKAVNMNSEFKFSTKNDETHLKRTDSFLNLILANILLFFKSFTMDDFLTIENRCLINSMIYKNFLGIAITVAVIMTSTSWNKQRDLNFNYLNFGRVFF